MNKEEEILRVLKEKGEMTTYQISKEISSPPSTLYRIMWKLKAERKIDMRLEKPSKFAKKSYFWRVKNE